MITKAIQPWYRADMGRRNRIAAPPGINPHMYTALFLRKRMYKEHTFEKGQSLINGARKVVSIATHGRMKPDSYLLHTNTNSVLDLKLLRKKT